MRPLKPLLYIGGEKSDNKRNIELFNEKPEYRVLLTTGRRRRHKSAEGKPYCSVKLLVYRKGYYSDNWSD